MTVLRLDAGPNTLLLQGGHDALAQLYLGPALPESLDLNTLVEARGPVQAHGELDGVPQEPFVPTDDGFPRLSPALRISRGGFDQRVSLQNWSWTHEDQSLRLSAQLVDLQISLQMDIQACPSGLLRFRTALINAGLESVQVHRLAAASLHLSSSFDTLTHFGGFWANEFQKQQTPLSSATVTVETRRGRSSHQSSPAVIATSGQGNDGEGEALLIAFEWSGNHSLNVTPAVTGGHLFQAWTPEPAAGVELKPGDVLESPWLQCLYTDRGLNGLRRGIQRHWLQRSPSRRRRKPLVHFNSWEASYFDHDADRMMALMEQAADLGAERFVLDDGWMAQRRSPGTGLGDWQPCPERYPEGLGPLGAHARSLGMEFGLWVEPEMLTLDSQLAARCPHWLVRAGDTEPLRGRGQHLLNIQRSDVRTYLLQRLEALITQSGAGYLKWDMNRDYADVGAGSLTSSRQMTEAFYDLLERCKFAHPEVHIEVCAAGGARADPGALSFADRLWPSDSMDPLQRFRILRNSSTFLPPGRCGWHVASAPSATSGANLPFNTRCLLMMLGHGGIELNPEALSDTERATLGIWIRHYKKERSWLGQAEFQFLADPAPGMEALLLLEGSDSQRTARQALLILLQSSYPKSGTPGILRLRPLEEAHPYRIELLNPEDCAFVQERPEWQCGKPLVLNGYGLARAELRLPFLRFGHAAAIRFSLLD